jgi:hypothetical protein
MDGTMVVVYKGFFELILNSGEWKQILKNFNMKNLQKSNIG